MTIPKIPTMQDFLKVKRDNISLLERIGLVKRHPSLLERALDLQRSLYSQVSLKTILRRLNELEYEALCLDHKLPEKGGN